MSDERFARQYRFELPSGFPLTSPCTSIVHHLSGPNIYALPWHFTKDQAQAGMHLTALPLSISLCVWVCNPYTRTHVRLLGPCFKTGRIGKFHDTHELALRSLEVPKYASQSGFAHGPRETHRYWMHTYRIRLLWTVSRTFHFLLKVLFIFPSRYLCTIGLPQIFSFRRILPPI